METKTFLNNINLIFPPIFFRFIDIFLYENAYVKVHQNILSAVMQMMLYYISTRYCSNIFR